MGIYKKTFRKYIKPEEILTVSKWADKYRVLPTSTSAEAGKYRSSRTPYVTEIMDKLSSHDRTCDTLVVMKCSQIGMSEAANNLVGYLMHHSPSPVLYMIGTIDLARRTSRQRIEPMIRAVPNLLKQLPKPKSGAGTNTVLERSFPGGHLLLCGSNSTNQLRQYSARYVILDEVDGYATSSEEGDPVSLAIQRTGGFSSRRKIFLLSTPTTEDESLIAREFEVSDKRYYNVPCPHCGIYQPLKWAQLHWEENKPDTAEYECIECKGRIPEKHKVQMLEAGKWVPTQTPQRAGLVGYHINGLYSPFVSWKQLAEQFLAAKRAGPHKLQVFVNTVLAEVWTQNTSTVEPDSLLARREVPWKKVPERCLVITAGVDVQQNRLECNVIGYGKGNEAWLLDYYTLYGDPNQPHVWNELDEMLQKTYEHESGNLMKIAGAGIDTGYATDRVYEYVRSRQFMRLFPLKGVAGWNRPIVSKPTKQSLSKKGVTVDLFAVGVDLVKAQVYSMLRTREEGPGFVHIPLQKPYDEDWLEGLTAEQLRTVYQSGKQKKVWRLKQEGMRNEPLDTTGYSFAVLQLLNVNWDKFQEYYENKPKQESNQEEKPKRKRKPRIRTGNGWGSI